MNRTTRMAARLIGLLTIFGALLALTAGNVSAQEVSTTTCFEETAVCTDPLFDQFWYVNGDEKIFGLPVTEARMETNPEGANVWTQWFEQARMEFHPMNPDGHKIVLGRIGAEAYGRLGQSWWAQYKALPHAEGCEAIETQAGFVFNLCGELRAYWRENGIDSDGRPGFTMAESVALFGLPISQVSVEANLDGDVVEMQWFERARLEVHRYLNCDPAKEFVCHEVYFTPLGTVHLSTP